jgi:hypothetical protein
MSNGAIFPISTKNGEFEKMEVILEEVDLFGNVTRREVLSGLLTQGKHYGKPARICKLTKWVPKPKVSESKEDIQYEQK